MPPPTASPNPNPLAPPTEAGPASRTKDVGKAPSVDGETADRIGSQFFLSPAPLRSRLRPFTAVSSPHTTRRGRASRLADRPYPFLRRHFVEAEEDSAWVSVHRCCVAPSSRPPSRTSLEGRRAPASARGRRGERRHDARQQPAGGQELAERAGDRAGVEQGAELVLAWSPRKAPTLSSPLSTVRPPMRKAIAP